MDTIREIPVNIRRCDSLFGAMDRCARYALLVSLMLTLVVGLPAGSSASRPLLIVASPAVKDVVEALGRAFERMNPAVRVQVAVDTSLDLRRTIAAMESRGTFFIESGPIHLVAPGGDELITRLEQKYYVLPDTTVTYATEHLVLIAPEALVDAPSSFESLTVSGNVRIAIADRTTRLGVETERVLRALRLAGSPTVRFDRANGTAGVLDHVLRGQADVGIVFGQDGVRMQDRVRILARAPADLYQPIPHSMAMERYCPDRALCAEFLRFVTSPEAQAIVKRLGYGPGTVSDVRPDPVRR